MENRDLTRGQPPAAIADAKSGDYKKPSRRLGVAQYDGDAGTSDDFARSLQRYSLGNLIRGLAGGGSSYDYGLELEVSQELALRAGCKPTGTMVPWQALAPHTRDLTVGTPTAGGHLVATELRPENFIDLLRPVSVLGQLGATQLGSLSGNIAIPRQTSATTAYWVAESGAPTESQPAFDQVPMSPKTLAAYTDVSRKMLLQSSVDISAFVAQDLRASFAQELDRAILNGSGSGSEPGGMLNNADIPLIELGTDGAALTWADVVNLYMTVANANGGDEAAGFVTTKLARGKLMRTEKVAGTGVMIWDSEKLPNYPGEGTIGLRRAISTTLMPANLSKGTGTNLSSMIYGDFSQLVIGTWGSGFDLLLDPYTLSSSGGLRITAMTDVDFTVRHPEAFVRVKDIVTT